MGHSELKNSEKDFEYFRDGAFAFSLFLSILSAIFFIDTFLPEPTVNPVVFKWFSIFGFPLLALLIHWAKPNPL